METVWLDDRMFFAGVDLADVLAEAAHCAIDEGSIEAVRPLFKGVIDAVSVYNFADIKLRKYLPLAIRSNDYEVIETYVDYMNSHTVKGPDDAKEFMKSMSHRIADLPETGLVRRDSPGLDRIQKQVILETIGQSWIRKSMPVAEIDWLP
jgi:hypothetical protein